MTDLARRTGYLITGAIGITLSSYFALMASAFASGIILLAIAFITNSVLNSEVLLGIIFAANIAISFITFAFLYYKLMKPMVTWTRKATVYLLGIQKSELAKVSRIDPFKRIWLWGYLLPIFVLSIIAIP